MANPAPGVPTLPFRNGDLMPMLGLGTWQAPPGEVSGAVRTAIGQGYRHIDCAAIYGNEAEIGVALSDCCAAGDVRREDLWVTSKLWNNRHAGRAVQPALEQTLRDLQLEHLDLYLIHWPVAHRQDVTIPEDGAGFLSLDDCPLAETWEAMLAVRDAGLTRHVGVSNFSAAKLAHLEEATGEPPEMDQVELHPYLQQRGLLNHCKQQGVHVTAYSPLGSPGRSPSMRVQDEPLLLGDSVVAAVAEEMGATPGQILIRWALERGTAVIPKSVNPERLQQNLDASGLRLSGEQMARLEELDRRFRYVDGTFWTGEGSPYTLASLWDE